MSSNEDAEASSSTSRRPHSIGEMAQIEVEQPARKMTLMFGERQVVFIRSDGLRSRIVREQLKKSHEESEEAKKKREGSSTIDAVIEDVARGNSGEPGPSNATGPSKHTSPSSDIIISSEQSTSSSLFNGDTICLPVYETTSETPEDGTNRKRSSNSTNRNYHPPKKFHGESTLVSHKKRWTYQTACNINAAEQSDDSQMYYIADPFCPMPRGRRNEISTATRMNYAAQRLDNRKFRGQVDAVNQIAGNANERVTCEKCGMRYFFESKQMQERISYLPSVSEEALPTVLFDCPVCKEQTRVFS